LEPVKDKSAGGGLGGAMSNLTSKVDEAKEKVDDAKEKAKDAVRNVFKR
jgi:hypothetical protein